MGTLVQGAALYSVIGQNYYYLNTKIRSSPACLRKKVGDMVTLLWHFLSCIGIWMACMKKICHQIGSRCCKYFFQAFIFTPFSLSLEELVYLHQIVQNHAFMLI